VLVQRRVCDEFAARLTRRCEAMVVGDPLDDRTEMGPVAGPRQFEGICAAIRRGEAEGARRLTGGPVDGAPGYFIRPTVLAGVEPESFVFREEIFGPVVAITPFETIEDALRLANDSQYALSSAIFTRDLGAAHRYIREIQAGLAHVNVHTGFKLPSMPFGGWKNSGCGLPENGRTGLEFFVERKAVYVGA
jgi:acyl-CoA reductase-like NAD-dependent aldehyde dehydrogenase